MNILKNSPSGQKCVRLSQFLKECPDYQCIKDPAMSLNIADLYQLTSQCFKELNNKIEELQTSNQTGGGKSDLTGPGPQPSGDLYDGTPLTNVKNLYLNVRKYMKLHKIPQLNETTVIPYGIILSTLNLPNNLVILNEFYPNLSQYLSKNKLVDKLNFETLVPIGIFLNETDLNNINHFKLNE